MKFVLEVELSDQDPATHLTELGRILRYWAGNLKHYELVPGTSETISDSAYAEVGTWRIEGSDS